MTTDTCIGCASAADCARFSAMLVCDADNGGACVECVQDADCATSEPVCDAKQCRGCERDDECPSGACAEDGTCVADENVVYLSLSGTDAVPCSKAAPCATLAFSLQQTNAVREHVVMSTGAYVGTAITMAPATQITIHGHGSSLEGGNADVSTMRSLIPTSVRDLQMTNSDPDGFAFAAGSSTVLERVILRGGTGLGSLAQVTATDLEIVAVSRGITNTGTLILDRVRIHGGVSGLISTQGTLQISNMLLYNTSGPGLDLMNTGGFISFSTIARTGLGGTGTFGARCSVSGVVFRQSIIWTSNTGTRPAVDGSCTQFMTSIVGPSGVIGAMNTNPSFVDEAANDLHLNGNSPARDVIETGPAFDFEGDSRPRGARFDLGADEAP